MGSNGSCGYNLRLLGAYAQRRVTVGDMLLSSSFVAYAGVFSKKYRDWLTYEKAMPFIIDRGVPLRQPAAVLAQLTNEAEMAL